MPQISQAYAGKECLGLPLFYALANCREGKEII